MKKLKYLLSKTTTRVVTASLVGKECVQKQRKDVSSYSLLHRAVSSTIKIQRGEIGDEETQSCPCSTLSILPFSIFSLIAYVSEKAKSSLNVYYLATVEYNTQRQ